MIQKKICLLGDFAVGKTSLVERYVYSRFEDKYISTIGVKISKKPITIDQQDLTLLIWDLAGNDDFNGTQANYIKGASGAIIVCDLTRRETLDKYQKYMTRLNEVLGQIPIIFLGNKNDLVDQIEIPPALLTETIRAFNVPKAAHFITSAKTGDKVETAFQTLGRFLTS